MPSEKPAEPIRVLFIEDSPDDAALVERELAKAGYAPETERVEDPEGLERAMGARRWDIVLSDFSMPRFTGAEALRQIKRAGLDVPFIIVSGSIGEEVAVEAMKAGAQDYFRKDNMHRLGAAVRRELADAAVRRERTAIVDALRQAEERYRLIVENVQDHAIFMLDERANVASWSGGAERITGFAASEIIGAPYAELFSEEARAEKAPQKELASARTSGASESEGWRLRRDGGRFWASSSLNAMVMGSTVVGYSVVLHDSTTRKELLDGLRLAVQARDEFLSIASHELKTPLASIVLQLGAVERLVDGESPVPVSSIAPKFKILARQVDRLLVLVDNLLDVTRITSGRLELAKTRVEFRDVLRAVLARMEQAIERSGSLVTLVAESGIFGFWDPLRLDTVVVNLLSNAIKYGSGRPIRIELDVADGRARLTVADGGIGIASADRDRIFERFERAVPVQHYGGFGIGLWLVRQIVEAHGGSITVSSVEGEGSTFTVHLPIEERRA